MKESSVILGIDPGFSFTGFSVLKQEDRSILLLDYGYLSLPTSKQLPARVNLFYISIKEKIIRHNISNITLETSFLGKNAQNFLKLGYLRGILYLLADQHNLSLSEFAPSEIKQAITGYGGASKEQVARVIMQLFPRMQAPKKQDVTDAIAISLCGLWRKPLMK